MWKTPFGGLDFEICKTDPPTLQIRICRDEVEAGATLPKSMIRFDAGSHPPSLVLMEKLAIGAVDAEPSRIVFVVPPFVQIWRKEA
jgi:hypothetical protein